MMAQPRTIGKLALTAVALVVGLIAYGAWVRVSGSGLGCPDWPLCNGQVAPADRASAIESGHRWYAGVTMLLVFTTAVVGARRRREFPHASALLTASAVLILMQALLGAAVVLTELHPLIRLVHLGLAMTIIATLTVAGMGLVKGREPALRLRRPGWHLLPAAAGVMLIGGSMVATGTSFQCAGLPLCDGSSTTMGTALHSAHRTLAVLTLLGAAFFAYRRWKAGERGPLAKVSAAVAGLLLAQVAIGVSAVALGLPPALRVLHLGVAAATWWGLVAAWCLAASLPKGRQTKAGAARKAAR